MGTEVPATPAKKKRTPRPADLTGIPDRIVREPERRAITGRSAVSWWRDEKSGKAPKRLNLGANAVGWWLSELLQWAKERERGGVQAPKTSRGKPKGESTPIQRAA